MMRTLTTLLILGAAATFAQAQENEKNIFLKAGVTSAYADLKDYLGGKTRGHAFEIGFDHAMPDNFSTISPWFGYARWIGEPRNEFKLATASIGPSFDVMAWRAGVDFKWNTPVKDLRAWAGLNVNFFDGFQRGGGNIPGQVSNISRPIPEGKAKFGARLGVDYAVTSEWSAHLQYDFGYWLSDSKKPRVAALNPVNPSWFTLSVGYHF